MTDIQIEPAESDELRNRRKVRTGVVTGDKMHKTVVVTIKNLVRHPMYGRILKQDKKLKAHDENNDSHVGDTVEIMETRPLSKDKCWRVTRIVEKAR
jgi:small subunit ribosomal protein S17